MDIESQLRTLHALYPSRGIRTSFDNEGRIRAHIMCKNGKEVEYIVVGDRFVEPPTKPPTQTCAPVGMDVFGGMGAR